MILPILIIPLYVRSSQTAYRVLFDVIVVSCPGYHWTAPAVVEDHPNRMYPSLVNVLDGRVNPCPDITEYDFCVEPLESLPPLPFRVTEYNVSASLSSDTTKTNAIDAIRTITAPIRAFSAPFIPSPPLRSLRRKGAR